jgi:putative ABC transport system permease protein
MTILVVGVGVLATLMVGGFITASFDGLRESIIHGGVGHLEIRTRESLEDFEEEILEFGLTRADQDSIKNFFASQEGVDKILPRLNFEGLVSNGDRSVVFLGQGMLWEDEESFSRIFSPFSGIVRGSSLSEDDKYGSLLGEGLAKDLGVSPGDGVTLLVNSSETGLNALDVDVVGLYRTGIPEYDKRAIYVSLSLAQELIWTDKVSTVVVGLEGLGVGVQERLGGLYEEAQGVFGDLRVRKWDEVDPFFPAVEALYSRFFTVLSVILGLVVLISTATTMVMCVLERRREMGTLRSFGFSRWDLAILFWLEGGMIGFLGGILGVVGAWWASDFLNGLGILMPPPPGRDFAYPLFFTIRPWMFGSIVVVSTFLCALSALFPSLKASKGTVALSLQA